MNYFNYFTEIEETFVRRRGKSLLLSPLDWALMESWQEQGIPLHVVLRAVEHVFDNYERNPSPRTIKGLLFCREEVEAQFTEWKAGQAGSDNGAEPHATLFPKDICDHIDGLVTVLRKIDAHHLADDIERACERLEEIKRNANAGDTETVDKSLSDVEKLLDEALLKRSDRARYKFIEREVASHLRPYKSSMDSKAYESTVRLLLLKRLREEEGVPRLSLFHL